MTQIQEKLKQKLEELNIRPAKLARESGVNYSSIKNLVQGKVQTPRQEILKKISNVLNVAPDELLFDKEPRIIDIIESVKDSWDKKLYVKITEKVISVYKGNNWQLDDQIKNYADQLYIYLQIKHIETGKLCEPTEQIAEYIISFFRKSSSNEI